MKKTVLLMAAILFLLLLAGCGPRTREAALEKADALVALWDSACLNNYTYAAEYQEDPPVYLLRMTVSPPVAASPDVGPALRSREIVAAGIDAVYPDLEACFRQAGDVDILIEVYDENGGLLYMSLNGA